MKTNETHKFQRFSNGLKTQYGILPLTKVFSDILSVDILNL